MCFSYKPRRVSIAEQHSDVIASSSERLQFIAAGQSGAVYGIDDKRVLKQYYEPDEGDVERQVYQCVGSHPHIARYLGGGEDGSIVLERGELLRTVCRQSGSDQIHVQRKLHWLRHAADRLRHLHRKDIIHADIGSHNMLLTKGDRLKIIDLAGASIGGGLASSRYEWFSYRPSVPETSTQTDIFAFGCMAYEIMTGNHPYHEHEEFCERARLVEQLYKTNQFPDVTHLLLGEVIQSCWDATFTSMNEVMRALKAASSLSWEAKYTVARFLESSNLKVRALGSYCSTSLRCHS